MGKLLLIGVLVIGVVISTAIVKSSAQAAQLPQIVITDVSAKETKNLSNYAARYALQFAESQHFPATRGFTKKQTFNNFFYRFGYIDSIRYSYVASKQSFLIKAYTRTTISGKTATHVGMAGIKGISPIGGVGDILHLSFENNYLDSSPNHNDGIGYGNIRFKNNGLNNSCIWPDGNDDKVLIPDNNFMDMTPEFSVVVWPNWNSNPNGWIPIYWKSLTPGTPNASTQPAYGAWIYQDYLYAGVTTASGQYIQAKSTTDIKPQGNWHFVAITFGQNYIKLYYDGALVGQTSAATSQPINSNQDLMILTMPATKTVTLSPVFFKGRFDEFGIYGYCLTATQVLSIYNSPCGIMPSSMGIPVVEYVKE